MIVIRNREMPKRCAECEFCIHQRTNDYGSYGDCILQNHDKVDCLVWRRDNGCPLMNVKQAHTDTDGNAEVSI